MRRKLWIGLGVSLLVAILLFLIVMPIVDTEYRRIVQSPSYVYAYAGAIFVIGLLGLVLFVYVTIRPAPMAATAVPLLLAADSNQDVNAAPSVAADAAVKKIEGKANDKTTMAGGLSKLAGQAEKAWKTAVDTLGKDTVAKWVTAGVTAMGLSTGFATSVVQTLGLTPDQASAKTDVDKARSDLASLRQELEKAKQEWKAQTIRVELGGAFPWPTGSGPNPAAAVKPGTPSQSEQPSQPHNVSEELLKAIDKRLEKLERGLFQKDDMDRYAREMIEYSKAVNAFNLRFYDEAIESYDRLMKDNPNLRSFLNTLKGYALFRADKLDAAEACLIDNATEKRAVASNRLAIQNLALIYCTRRTVEDRDRASELLRAAAASDVRRHHFSRCGPRELKEFAADCRANQFRTLCHDALPAASEEATTEETKYFKSNGKHIVIVDSSKPARLPDRAGREKKCNDGIGQLKEDLRQMKGEPTKN